MTKAQKQKRSAEIANEFKQMEPEIKAAFKASDNATNRATEAVLKGDPAALSLVQASADASENIQRLARRQRELALETVDLVYGPRR